MIKHFYPIVLLLFAQLTFGQTMGSKKTFANDSVYITLSNPFLAPTHFKITPKDSLKGTFRYKSSTVFQSKDTIADIIVLPLSMVPDTSAIALSNYLDISANFGDPENSTHDNDYLYTLPFQKGKKYKIIQSFGGKFSHSKEHSRYAIDFGLQIGDTISAAREGKVVLVKEDSQEHGRTYEYANKGNKIVIMHADGTFASYVHLDFEGAIVEVGDNVKSGQPIGISGMTGFTTIPHLHLVIYSANSVSVPFYFRDYPGQKLKPNKRYKRKL